MHDWDDPDLDDVAAQLREHRHHPTPLELDQLKRRALGQAHATQRVPGAGRRRLITVLLVAGLGTSAASAGVIAGSSRTAQAPSASLAQYQEVLPVVAGTARLRAPSGCLRGATFRARVTGSNIAQVVFRLDGRVIRRLTRTGTVRTLATTIRTRTLSRGTHRITATITFRPETGLRARTLRVSVVRCARRNVAPKFTG